MQPAAGTSQGEGRRRACGGPVAALAGVRHPFTLPKPIALLLAPPRLPCSCIPVIIQDDVEMAWHSLLDVPEYSVRIAQKDMARIPGGGPPWRAASECCQLSERGCVWAATPARLNTHSFV